MNEAKSEKTEKRNTGIIILKNDVNIEKLKTVGINVTLTMGVDQAGPQEYKPKG